MALWVHRLFSIFTYDKIFDFYWISIATLKSLPLKTLQKKSFPLSFNKMNLANSEIQTLSMDNLIYGVSFTIAFNALFIKPLR